jgi:hypothetical protein
MYFGSMPNIYYDFVDKNGQPYFQVVKDITTNVRLIQQTLDNITVYDYYDLIDGETLEIVSAKVYGTPNYHWMLAILNEIYDYRQDLPLTYNVLSQYVTDKYGSGNEYATHHFVDANGFIVNSDAPGAAPVSNYDYEETINETKRRIKLVSKPVLDSIAKQYDQMF